MSQASTVLTALYAGKKDEAAYLASKKSSLDLFEAAALGRTARVTELLEQHAPRAKKFADDGYTALHLAAFFGHVEAARVLLQHGAEVDAIARNPTKVTPLHSAAAIGSRELIVLLLDAGARVNEKQKGGFTALQACALQGNVELVRLLLERGADPLLRADDGRSAEGMAREKGHAAVVAALGERKRK